MADILNENEEPVEEDGAYVYTLTDEEGNEHEFVLLMCDEVDGKTYYAMAPNDEPDSEEYVILRAEEESEDDVSLVSIDDDDEFERVSSYFDDKLFGDVDYDAE